MLIVCSVALCYTLDCPCQRGVPRFLSNNSHTISGGSRAPSSLILSLCTPPLLATSLSASQRSTPAFCLPINMCLAARARIVPERWAR